MPVTAAVEVRLRKLPDPARRHADLAFGDKQDAARRDLVRFSPHEHRASRRSGRPRTIALACYVQVACERAVDAGD